MTTFNRIVIIFVCLLLIAAAIALIFFTWTIPNRSINGLFDAVQWLDDHDGSLEKSLLTTISAAVGLISLAVLLIELLPHSGPEVQVVDVNQGDATLSTAAIGQRIEEAVCRVPHVAEVRAGVRAKKKGVLVALDLQVDPDANLATVTDEACRTAQDVLTSRVHVQLLRPISAHLHYRELRLQTRAIERRAASNGSSITPVAPVARPPEAASPAIVRPTLQETAVAVAEPPETSVPGTEPAESAVAEAEPLETVVADEQPEAPDVAEQAEEKLPEA